MPQRLKRQLGLSCLTVLAAVVILLACWLLPDLIPPHWQAASRFTTQISSESYLVPGSQHINYVQIDVIFAAQGEGLQSSTLVTAGVSDRAYPRDDNAGSVRGDRAAALNRIRAEFPSLCIGAGYPEVSTRFDDVIKAGKTGITFDYPERRRAAVLMAVRPFVTFAATAALLVSLPLTLYFLFVTLKSRRAARANCCRRCGYSLAGLAHAALCPECGSNIETDLARGIARRGRTRRVAGWLLLAAGLGLATTWLASAKTYADEFRLFSHTAADSTSSYQVSLSRGGLRFNGATLPQPPLFPGAGLVGSAPVYIDDLDPIDGDGRPLVVPIDWSLWHYTSSVRWATYTTLWLSLWPIALLALVMGGVLLRSGFRARSRARKLTSLTPPLRVPK